MASSENPEKTLDNVGYVLKNNGPTQEDNTHERDPVTINNCNLCKECKTREKLIFCAAVMLQLFQYEG